MAFLADVLSWMFLLAGGAFAVIGGIGMIRLPDLFTRMHAAGITDTLGAGLMVVGMIFQAGFTQVSIKLVLIMIFIFFTSPTATHGVLPWTLRVRLRTTSVTRVTKLH